ncbi:hypothetical protein FZ103_09640 [Streptomonospora sp. PA3]|uniref:hypothetical protein n=1 Tax=Streptomonospora sp. PA3 TaxID=2607326 RepID=UPI0012DF0658|nr:hypothetical protein [Streptomonospora sp. PA3]MUL41432.1 hypothetical protein [Streptomonospora sp. PA3]
MHKLFCDPVSTPSGPLAASGEPPGPAAPPGTGSGPDVSKDTARSARDHGLGALVSVHTHGDVDHRRAAVYVLATGAAAAAVLVAADSVFPTASDVPRLARAALLLPVLPAALWAAAVLRGRTGVYLFERGFVLRTGRRSRAVRFADLVALKHTPGSSGAGDVKLWTREGRTLVLSGLDIPDAAPLFAVLRRHAARRGLPAKRPKP